MRSLLITGVLLLTLLTFYSALWFKSETIEDDITNRVNEDLNTADAKDIDIDVDGRHVTLTGVVYDAATEDAYLETANSTYGALGPIDGLTLRDGMGFLKAVKSPDGITLTGAVPSEEARIALLEAATSGTEGTVTDAMTVGAAAGAWTEEAGFGIAQMAGLTTGTLSATSDSYTLSGTTDGDATALSASLNERAGWQSFVSAPNRQIDMDGQINALESELSGLEGQVETLTADLGARDETVAGLTSERDTLAASLTAMTLLRDDAVEQTNASTAELVAQRDALATDLESAHVKSGVQSDTIAGLTGENDALKQSLATVTSERDTARTDLENLRASLDDTQSSTASLQALLSEAQGQVAERDVIIEGLNGEVTDLKDQLTTQTASLNAGEQDDAALRAQIAEQSGMIETLTSDVAARGETILRLQGENDTLAKDVDAKTAMVAERDATVAALETSLASAGSEATTTSNVAAPAAMAAQCSARAGEILQNAQINFASGTANIRDASVPTLERLTGIALACGGSGMSVEIGGHTDSQGSDENNQQLSERRAQAVAQFMTDRGVPAGTLQPVGFGEAQPVGDNETVEGRQANRRISFEWQVR